MGTKQKAKRKGTRNRIISTARNLFSESSYLGVSMGDIAKKLNITQAALYYHFSSKAEIYNKVLEEASNSLSASLKEALNEKTIEGKLHKLIKNYVGFGLKEHNLVKAVVLNLPEEAIIQNHVVQIRKQIADTIEPMIKDIIKSKNPLDQAEYRLVTSLLISMMDGLILQYSLINQRVEIDKITNLIIKFVLNDRDWNASKLWINQGEYVSESHLVLDLVLFCYSI